MAPPTRVNPIAGFGRGERVAAALLCIIAAAFFLRADQLAEGSFLNSYPYISSDGFDWIYEGHVLIARLQGEAIPPLLILRNPGFVMVVAADAWLHAGGSVVLFVLALSSLVTQLSVLAIGRLLGAPAIMSVPFAFACAVTTMGFYRVWILSDSLAVALMMVSVWGLVRCQCSGRTGRALTVASCAALLGGLTQSYSLIPFLVGLAVYGVVDLVGRRRLPWEWLTAAASVLGGTVAGLMLWRSLIPHEGTPDQFVLLKLTAGMSDYYDDVWGFVLAPFAPLVVAVASARVLRQPIAVHLWIAVLSFIALSFFYQWGDSRFTGIYVPLLMTAVLAAIAAQPAMGPRLPALSDSPPVRRLTLATALFVGAQGMLVAPQSDWSPSWTAARIAPRETWLGEAGLQAAPVDRFGLRAACGSLTTFCEGVRVPEGYDPYATRIMTDYLAYQQRAARKGLQPPP